MRFIEIDVRANRYNLVRINPRMRDVVVLFYVLHVAGFGNVSSLKYIFGEIPEIGIIPNLPNIAFKMHIVHRIKPVQGCEHADIRFSELISTEISLF